nr:hypothetical protein [Tanacetum cinerariifolium]
MGDEHLSTISEMESDKVIKSSVKNLVPIPCESEVTYDNESECDVPVNDESYMIFTNPLFDCNEDFTSCDDESLSNEDVPMENFKIYLNSLFDNEESISTKIDPHYFNEADFDLEEEIRLVENLFYDNSFPRPPKELNAEIADTIVESLSPSSVLVEDSDSQMEEIDLFIDTDDLIPSGIKSDNYDSEGDFNFLEEFLSDDSLYFPENESSYFDHHNDSSFHHPLLEPPDVEIFFDFKPNMGVLTAKVVKGISEHYVFIPRVLPSLPNLFLNIDSLISFSSENEDKVFNPEKEPEEEEENEAMENDEEDDAEVINPYEEADPHNRPPPTSDEETEFAPPVVQIANVDDVPIPPVIQFGSNFHVVESSASRDLLEGNSEVCAPGLMCCDLKSVHRGVKRLTLDLVVRANRSKSSKMMRLIIDLSREFTELKNQNRRAEELSRWEAWVTGRIPNSLRFQEEPSIHIAPVLRADNPYVMVRDAARGTRGDEDVDTDAPRDTQPPEPRGSPRDSQ